MTDNTTEEIKHCPFCDEEIRTKAVICKHCGQWMPGYSYESAIRDLVIQKQVTEIEISSLEEDMKSREGQLKLALEWTVGSKLISFKGFDLSAQELKGVDLSGADLSESNLREADLSGANLQSANLTDAKLWSSDLSETNLQFANLSGVKLSGAKYTNSTRWPDGFDPKASGAILIDDYGNPIKKTETGGGQSAEEQKTPCYARGLHLNPDCIIPGLPGRVSGRTGCRRSRKGAGSKGRPSSIRRRRGPSSRSPRGE